MKFRFHQIAKDGERWTSPVVFDAPDVDYVKRSILGGWLMGTSYWATNEDTGQFIHGLDAKGRTLVTSP